MTIGRAITPASTVVTDGLPAYGGLAGHRHAPVVQCRQPPDEYVLSRVHRVVSLLKRLLFGRDQCNEALPQLPHFQRAHLRAHGNVGPGGASVNVLGFREPDARGSALQLSLASLLIRRVRPQPSHTSPMLFCHGDLPVAEMRGAVSCDWWVSQGG